MARLSTHVLDTSRGVPAAGVVVELRCLERGHVNTVSTDGDGRVLLSEDAEVGVYELLFRAGDYFRAEGIPLNDPPFLDEIVIRFGIAAASGKYHVPLLLSPYGYSTYRGS